MDMALDDVVAANRPKGTRRPSRRGGAKSQVLGAQPSNPVTRAKTAPVSSGPKVVTASTTEKIIVSGLPQDVTETQVKELFHQTVGPLRQVNLHYDAQGRSKGVAEVIFNKKGDGNKAQQQYHDRLIDGS
ncbi:hypothetical protein EUX98_g3283 [Antrodiella citrinella]|uniref:RRM domain-containing protein n=1 Tax=Antrodiella citrinella TaxID=2447956 RepID=A0A4S4MZ36_9APHY|nr:hypothetical protein EUX98_g3283 [Antrodiella citrinella]